MNSNHRNHRHICRPLIATFAGKKTSLPQIWAFFDRFSVLKLFNLMNNSNTAKYMIIRTSENNMININELQITFNLCCIAMKILQ